MRIGANTRIVVALVLVFLAGIASGVFAGAWHARHVFAGRHGERMGERMREHLQHQLKLTPAQLQEMNPIFDDLARQLQEIRAESGRRVSETMARAHEQLAAHLTPAQQGELRQIEQRHEGMMRRHHRAMPPPPPEQR
jgi:Spy/CpxP family protein refolding chaperone